MSYIHRTLGVVLESRVEFHHQGVLVIPERYGLLINLRQLIGDLGCNTHKFETELVDLGMVDTEYAQALSEGRHPLHENAIAQALAEAGVNPTQAQQVAPLFGRVPRSTDEQERVLDFWREWCLLQGFRATEVEQALKKTNHLSYPAYLCGFLHEEGGAGT